VLPRQLAGDPALSSLEVFSDSMKDAAIADGDMLVVRQQPKAENGEIAAAAVDGQATVKTLKLPDPNDPDGHIWLMPCNAGIHADSR
jgi:repressor LexA